MKASLCPSREARSILTGTGSSACRKFDRPALLNGGGQPSIPPIPARKSSMIVRVAMALPIVGA